jgi:propanol-preferring alcohol dehydrogenase
VRALRIHEWGGELRAEDLPDAPPGPGEAAVRVEACGVGLTVLNAMRGHLSQESHLLPRVPGHELVGRVDTVGEGVGDLRPGDRVTAYFYLACGHCQPCRTARDSRCANLAGWVGVHRDGGFAERVVLPAHNLLPVPESIAAVAATAIPDAIATPLHVCRRAGVAPGDRVAVVGAGGGVGIHMVQMARLFGAEVAGLEREATKRLFLERELGIPAVDSSDFSAVSLPAGWQDGPDVVVDFLGSPASMAWGLGALRTGGRLIAVTTFRDVSIPIAPRDLVFRELAVLGSRYASRAEVVEAANLVETGRIRPIVSQVARPADLAALIGALRAGSLLGRGALVWN